MRPPLCPRRRSSGADEADASALTSELDASYLRCDADPKDDVDAPVAAVVGAHGRINALANMSPVNGVLAIPNIASHNLSKGGLNPLIQMIALALATHGIRVNTVAPGTIATELAVQAVLTSAAAKAKVPGHTPLKRLGEPDKAADVMAWLVSDVIGEIVKSDRGRMALHHTVPV